MRFNRIFVAATAVMAFFLQSCTSTVSSSNDNPFSDDSEMTEEEFEALPLDSKELIQTYILLGTYYVNADKEVGDILDYYQQGASHNYTADLFEFPDVSYMFSTVSDNYTRYFSPSIANQIINMLIYSEEQIGIGADFREIPKNNCEGIAICNDTNTLVFNHVYPGSPAEKAGIQKGDTLYTVNGMVPRNEEQYRRIEGVFNAGESVPFRIKRGEELLPFDIIFDTFLTPTVFVDEVDSIPVITITEFTDTTYLTTGTYGEFVDALNQTDGAEATILDLRGNPGGSVDQCVSMTEELLPKNDTIISLISHMADSITGDAYVDTITYIAEEDGIAAGRYFVILADSGSASCAELMIAGTVSNTKSPVVGLTTYGKGIGQTYFITYAGALAGITSMKLEDKDGVSYHRYGIVPDYVEGDYDKAMQKAVELAHEKKAVRTQGYGTVDTGHFTLAKSKSGKAFERGGTFKINRNPIKPKPIPFK